ncbi:MAG TPA: hypothetical protein VET65_04735, partial [Candidatus Limnocylindrales bacterium]|nr:hypothetical protein [Candidatus Limnocylindrales bacterium]
MAQPQEAAPEPGPAKAPIKVSGRRELKPPEWFEERLRVWVERMGLGAWTIHTSYKPKLRGGEGFATVRTEFLEADLQFRQDVLVERG